MESIVQSNAQYSSIIGELVASDYRKADIFKRFNIDFCCKGKITLEEVCKNEGIDLDDLLQALNELEIDQKVKGSQDFDNWELDKLIDHIINKHHSYVKESIPVIIAYTEKVANVHGNLYPQTREVFTHFSQLAQELTVHMQKEENILFPYVRQLATAQKSGEIVQAPFGSVENPINMMVLEHESAGNELEQIKSLTDTYSPPPDACTTFIVSYSKLNEFAEDLMLHIHLENNILFPKALALEKSIVANNQVIDHL